MAVLPAKNSRHLAARVRNMLSAALVQRTTAWDRARVAGKTDRLSARAGGRGSAQLSRMPSVCAIGLVPLHFLFLSLPRRLPLPKFMDVMSQASLSGSSKPCA